MHLSSIRVFNYKSFVDSGTIYLMPGINIIVGQNNAGKTALLETMSFDFQNVPHESLASKPTKNIKNNQPSITTFGVKISSDELKQILNVQDALAFAIPKTFESEKLESPLDSNHKPPDELLNLLNSLLYRRSARILGNVKVSCHSINCSLKGVSTIVVDKTISSSALVCLKKFIFEFVI